MILSVFIPLFFALFALYKNKVTYPAAIAAYIMGIIIYHYGGIYAFLALAITFILTILSDKLKDKKEHERRTIYQMFSNIFTSTLCIILYRIISNEIFYIMYFVVIGTSLSDTLASNIGSLSKTDPINPLTFKKVKKGESGAISFLGISASIFGGIIIGLIYYYLTFDIYMYLFIIIMTGLGSYIDSIFGITIQAKYKCDICKKQVEKRYHCNEEGTLIKGYHMINNDVVNLLNNISVFIISYLLLK